MESKTEKTEVYYGQIKCQEKYKSTGKDCVNKAYYLSDGKYVCGVHSDKQNREELPKNGKAVKDAFDQEYKLHLESIQRKADKNKSEGKQGHLICTKMLMMKNPPLIEGYLNVFPNYKHQNRKDGFGCSSLSPKSMGPIEHSQSGLPVCKNLENFHQGNKCFPSEVDSDGRPTSEFYQTQIKMYEDHEPHRHKLASGKKNVPLFSVWKTPKGEEKHFSYIESRQFYCNYYERFALKDPNFIKLKQLLNDGVNLNIRGYDAYMPEKDLEFHYLDKSRPFGHELVLYTLLITKEEEKENYPWRKHKTENF